MALVLGNHQTFWIEWEDLNSEVAEQALIALQSRVMDHTKFEVTRFTHYSSLKGRVTTADCTPIRNMMIDAINEAEQQLNITNHEQA